MRKVKKFEKHEVDFIIENYPKYGTKFCAEKLNRSVTSIKKKVERIKIIDKIDIRCTEQYKNQNLQKDNLLTLVKESCSITDLSFRVYGNDFYGNRQTLKKHIIKNNIDTSHFTSEPRIKRLTRRIRPIHELLIENSITDTTSLKHRLYKLGLKNEICELCGQSNVWNGKKMSLRLDHINGNNTDNRIENLRIVCPNCDATLDTFSGRNVKQNKKSNVKKQKQPPIHNKCMCGKEKNKRAKKCIECYNELRKSKRKPNFEVLLSDIEALGYLSTGKKYGVSDNTIRKWVKLYQKNELNLKC